MKLKILIIIVLTIVFQRKLLFAQDNASKYYLIDSIDIENIAESDKILLDSILPLYHASKNDTQKIKYIEYIVEESYDDNIWPRYNLLLKKLAINGLKNNNVNFNLVFKRELATSYSNQGYFFDITGNNDSAIYYYQKGLKILLEINDKKGIANSYNNLGYVYKAQGKSKEAYEFYEKSLKIRKQINDQNGSASCYLNMASLYFNQGKLQEALDNSFKALELFEKIKNKKGASDAINNIGFMYQTYGDFKNALIYYKKSLSIQKDLNNQYAIAYLYTNIGSIYKERNILDTALMYFEKSAKLQVDNQDGRGLAATYNNIADVYFVENNLEKAISYYNQSLENSDKVGDLDGKTTSLVNLSKLYMSKKQFNRAAFYAKQASELAFELQYPNQMRDASYLMFKIYKQNGNYKDALEYQTTYYKMRDSVQNVENQKAALKKQMEYDFEKEKLSDSLQNAEKQRLLKIKHQQEIKKQKLYTYIGLGGFVFMLSFAFFIYRSYRNKKKANDLISKQKKEIEEKHDEIQSSITYAQRIQSALLYSDESWENISKDYFVLSKPRDVVSGDFFWAFERDNIAVWTVADCTGHGVPGAFMSMLGVGFLNEIVSESAEYHPDKILMKLRSKIINSLHQKDSNSQQKDGMDIALCVLEKDKQILHFSGAYNPAYIVRKFNDTIPEDLEKYKRLDDNGYTLFEINGDKQPIGSHLNDKKPFTTKTVKLQQNDVIYVFSDGFVDQFGGENGRKYMSKNFKSFLLSIQNTSDFKSQREIVDNEFNKWLGSKYQQIDDVCVSGVKIT